MKRLLISSMLSILLLTSGSQRAFANKQEHVDYLVNRIGRALQHTLQMKEKAKWAETYKVAAWNIADLRRTLAQGGQLKSNPVQAFQQELGKEIQKRQIVLRELARIEKKLNEYPGKIKARLMINLSAKLFKTISLIFDHSATDAAGLTKSDMKNIKRDFEHLKTREERRRKIKEMRDAILPSLNNYQERYYALIPLVTAYSKLPGAKRIAAAERSRQAADLEKLHSHRLAHPIAPRGRHWKLVQTLTWVDPDINANDCYQTSLKMADGTFTFNEQKNKCNKPYYTYTVQGTWSTPPSFLLPGKEYPLSAQLSGKFTVSGNGYLNVYMDVADTKCGGSTRRSKDISGALRIRWNGEHSAHPKNKSFTAPLESYGNAQGQFQIKATTNKGCVRYIYQWMNN